MAEFIRRLQFKWQWARGHNGKTFVFNIQDINFTTHLPFVISQTPAGRGANVSAELLCTFYLIEDESAMLKDLSKHDDVLCIVGDNNG